MKFYIKCSWLFLVFSIITERYFSQEQLRPLSANVNLTSIKEKLSYSVLNKITATVSVIDLPFFDDFSYAYKSAYPAYKNWKDSSVYVNVGFGKAPVSLGVATFDGLNKKGFPYNILAPVTISAAADYLTSQPINLEKKGLAYYSPADSIYLSFYYQAEGNGEAPEASDSLCLDFFKPNQNKWQTVWGHKGYNPGSTDTSFHMIMLAIKDTAYFDSLFQFRFRNKATLSGSLDHWNVDYILLNKGRNIADTVFDDDAFVYSSSSFLKNYSTMPYRQFIPSEMAPSVRNFIRNNFTGTKNTTYEYKIYDASNVNIYSYPTAVSSGNILPFNPNGYYNYAPHSSPPVTPFVFPYPLIDSTRFNIIHRISSSLSEFDKANDSLIQTQKFSNYYAYDDGGAELGYYLNTYGAKMAVRYTLNVIDTLKAMKVYFDPVVEGQTVQGSSFRLMVWQDGSNGPGNVLYRDSLVYPIYLQGSYGLVPVYNLTSCLPLTPGTYYVGLQQTTNMGLNVGFDRNTNHMNALYYDVGDGWKPSAIAGSIMINPVMGCTIPVGIRSYEKDNLLEVYPNPAQNQLTISYPGIPKESMILEFYSVLGKHVESIDFINNQTIDINHIPDGIYFIYIKGTNLSLSPKKLIIAR